MARGINSLARAAFDAAESVASQPQLFDSAVIPLDLELGKAAFRLAHTGQTTTRDEARVMAIAACKLAGLSDKETAKRVGCSRNTIGPVMEHLESSGMIPALQQRLAHALGRVAESSARELQQIIDDGDWTMDTTSAVRSLGVAMGIATEKMLLVTGQVTARIETMVGAPADAVKAWEEKLRQVFGPVIELPPDSQSVASSPKCLSDRDDIIVATHSATHDTPSVALLVADPARPGAQGAGGVAPGDGDGERRRVPSNNL